MADEVQENKRFKVTDRRVATEELFTPRTLSPTVGAGGQFTVAVQQPAQSPFSRLAEGLSSLNSALGSVAESDVAANELAAKEAADLSTDEILQKQTELKETEDGLYKSGGFLDRLTRKGSISHLENPLTYARGQRAAGTKLGLEKYTEDVSKRLKEAQNQYRINRTDYDLNEIQKEVMNQIKDEFQMDQGFSMERGFNSAISKFSADQRIRDFNEKEKITRVFSIGDAADELSSSIIGSSTISPEMLKGNIRDITSRHGNLSRKDWDSALRVALSRAADRNPTEAQTMINMMRDGRMEGVNFGGFDASSSTFEAALDAAESEIATIERKIESDSAMSLAKVQQQTASAKKGVESLDFTEPKTLDDLGVDTSSLSEEALATQYNSAEEMQKGVDAAFLNGAELGRKGMVRSAIAGYDSNEDNRNNSKDVMRANSAAAMESTTRSSFGYDNDVIASQMKGLIEQGESIADIRREGERGIKERRTVSTTGLDMDKKPVLIGETPFLEASRPEQEAWFAAQYESVIDKQNDLIASKRAKLQVDNQKDNAEINNNKSSVNNSDTFKAKYNDIVPRKLFMDKMDNNYTWNLAKADSNVELDFISERQLRHPSNRGKGLAYIDSIEKAKRRRISAAVPGLAGAFVTDVTDFANAEDKRKLNNLGVMTLKRTGVTMNELRTLDRGRIVIGGKTSIIVTDDLLIEIPLRNASDQDLKDAASIINDDFGSAVTAAQLKEAIELDNQITNIKTKTE